MSTERVHWSYFLHLAIGLFFMLVFPHLSPIEPITQIGMAVLGVFIGMVYLWSTMDSIWPSFFGLLLIALSGYVPELSGYAAVKQLFLDSFGSETVIGIMLCMILFSGVEYVGCTQYIARFFMSRKVLEGRPYVFMFIFLFCGYIISGLTQAVATLLILWPIAIEVCKSFGYQKGDKIFYILMCGVYLSATLGQPAIPLKGAPYILVSAYTAMSGIEINVLSYMAYNFVMSILMLIIFLLIVKFIFRPDVEGFKKITVAELTKEKLPKMNAQQIAFFVAMIIFVTALLMPTLVDPSTSAISKLCANLGYIGVTGICLVVLMIIPYKGKGMLDFRAIARKSFSWDTYFLVAAALYACNAMTAESTGIKPFLVQMLQPLLGGKPEIVFIFLILAFAIITTNFANNVGMATVLMPIIIAFADQYPGVNATVLCMTVCMMVFVALLTPAASPYCGMLFARKDLVTPGQITKTFLPVFVSALIIYTILGYPLAKIFF